MPNQDAQSWLGRLLDLTIQRQASDLHLTVGHRPTVRVDGALVALEEEETLSPDDTEALAAAMLDESQRERLARDRDVDVAYSHGKAARFRVNAFFQQGSQAVALRLLPAVIPTIEELRLPPVVREFAHRAQGFVLVAGPSGHGKSTTMAALINEVNRTRRDHVITIEDPVEFVFPENLGIVDQREIGRDAGSFARALRSALRQDPDVIMVGEMRDLETIGTALTAAETGHLVFATLHTNDAAQSIDRIIDSFPPAQQEQVRVQLASTLLGTVSLRLVPRVDGGRIPAVEVLLANTAVRNLIRENKTHQLGLVIETSAEDGMISLNKSLASLVQREEISLENAELYSSNPEELRLLLHA